MLSSDVKDFLARGLESMGLRLHDQPEALDRLVLYFQELQKWNHKVNLVARTLDERQVLENHFLDSLSLLANLDQKHPESETILDVGTGAGFPGLVIKAACPPVGVTLIEPRRNRYYFLRHIIRILALDRVALFNIRLEEGKTPPELTGRRYTLITSRAFTDISGFVGLTSAYLEKHGRIVCMKGPGALKELAEIERDKGLPENYRATSVLRFRLPYSQAERAIIEIRIS